MKKIIMLSIATLSSSVFALKAQTNLVENPSFEIYDTCPHLQNEVSYAVGWHHFDGTPDYFNACCPFATSSFCVPYNWGGYQQAASGVAYSAFGSYQVDYDSNIIREFIGGTLSPQLTIGTKYFVSFKVSLSISDQIAANCAINKLGATFSILQYQFANYAPFLINNNPKVYEDSIIKDSTNWTTVFGSFIADSAYKYVIIGNFFDNIHTDTLILDTNVDNICIAYYFLDDVCVSTDSLYALNYTDTVTTTSQQVEEPNRYDIYPNPTNNLLNIRCNRQQNGLATLSIMDITGREVLSFVNSSNTPMQIDVSSLSSGMYFISFKTKDTYVIQKFIKY